MDAPLPGHYPAPPLHDAPIFHSAPCSGHPTLTSPQGFGLESFHFDPQLENQPEIQHPHQRNVFDQDPFVERPRPQQPRFHEIRSNVPLPPTSQPHDDYGNTQTEGGMFSVFPRIRQQQSNEVTGGQFGVLSPHPQLLPQHLNHDEQLGRFQQELDLHPAPATEGGTTAGHFNDLKIVPNPPNLQEWRQRLFDVD